MENGQHTDFDFRPAGIRRLQKLGHLVEAHPIWIIVGIVFCVGTWWGWNQYESYYEKRHSLELMFPVEAESDLPGDELLLAYSSDPARQTNIDFLELKNVKAGEVISTKKLPDAHGFRTVIGQIGNLTIFNDRSKPLTAFSIPDLKREWNYDVSAGRSAFREGNVFKIVDNRILFAKVHGQQETKKTFISLNGHTGKVQQKATIRDYEPNFSDPCYSAGRVVATNGFGQLLLFDMRDGDTELIKKEAFIFRIFPSSGKKCVLLTMDKAHLKLGKLEEGGSNIQWFSKTGLRSDTGFSAPLAISPKRFIFALQKKGDKYIETIRLDNGGAKVNQVSAPDSQYDTIIRPKNTGTKFARFDKPPTFTRSGHSFMLFALKKKVDTDSTRLKLLSFDLSSGTTKWVTRSIHLKTDRPQILKARPLMEFVAFGDQDYAILFRTKDYKPWKNALLLGTFDGETGEFVRLLTVRRKRGNIRLNHDVGFHIKNSVLYGATADGEPWGIDLQKGVLRFGPNLKLNDVTDAFRARYNIPTPASN